MFGCLLGCPQEQWSPGCCNSEHRPTLLKGQRAISNIIDVTAQGLVCMLCYTRDLDEAVRGGLKAPEACNCLEDIFVYTVNL